MAVVFLFKPPPSVVPVQATLKEKILQMDLPGALTITASIMCYLLALSWGGALKPWNSPDVIGTLVGFVLLFALFVVIEWKQGDRALLNPSVLRNRTITTGCAFAFL